MICPRRHRRTRRRTVARVVSRRPTPRGTAPFGLDLDQFFEQTGYTGDLGVARARYLRLRCNAPRHNELRRGMFWRRHARTRSRSGIAWVHILNASVWHAARSAGVDVDCASAAWEEARTQSVTASRIDLGIETLSGGADVPTIAAAQRDDKIAMVAAHLSAPLFAVVADPRRCASSAACRARTRTLSRTPSRRMRDALSTRYRNFAAKFPRAP